jgi:hypothetical protein
MGKCNLCVEQMPDEQLLEHLRIVHPEIYGDGPLAWPDGGLVIIDRTVQTPGDILGDDQQPETD